MTSLKRNVRQPRCWQMKRFLISVAVGTSITLVPAIVALFRVNHPDTSSIIALWLYGPSMMISSLGLGPDCINANSISEKLDCIRFGLIVDLIVYSLVIVMVHIILFRRERSAQLSPLN